MTTTVMIANFGPDPVNVETTDGEGNKVTSKILYVQETAMFVVHDNQKLALVEDRTAVKKVYKTQSDFT